MATPEDDELSMELVRRNREIAEVREDLTKSTSQLAVMQARNAALLEETSVLDSDVTRHLAEAANLEMEAAEAHAELSARQAIEAACALSLEEAAQAASAGDGLLHLQGLRSEVQEAEQEAERLRTTLERTREQSVQALQTLQTSLDDARASLHQSISETGGAHKAEMGKLDEEIRAGDEQIRSDALSEQLYNEEMRELRLRVQEHSDRAASGTEPSSGRCAVLAQELAQVQQEMKGVEGQLSTVEASKSEAWALQERNQVEGDQRLRTLRRKIEDIWQALRVVS